MRGALAFLLLAACSGHGAHGDDDDGGTLKPPSGCDALDTDGDGFSDAVEQAMGTSPTDATDNPDSHHQIVFAVPFQGAPRPSTHDVSAPAKVSRADVVVVLDTSGSMLGTDTRIQDQFHQMVTQLAGQVDDLAFGAAGFGDFPVDDGANSQYDVPFYVVHRVQTAKTAAGLTSIINSLTYKNIITDGLGPWFAGMRGGDDPEQGWEALRQVATGIGITYPNADGTGTSSVPPFSALHLPATPAGEEIGTIGGMGFRENSLPIVLLVSDTSQHDDVNTASVPVSANQQVAEQALAQINAHVVGVKTFFSTGDADFRSITEDTGSFVTPDVWGSGADRPANCPAGKCCLTADDPDFATTQPDPVNGTCALVFLSDKYDTGLSNMLAQGVLGVARGVRFAASAKLVDDPSDTIDTTIFVDHVEALAAGDCANGAVTDTDHDGIPDTFDAIVPGSNVCFRITARVNESVMPAAAPTKYRALLQLTGNGLADLAPIEVFFVVPADECSGPVIE